MDGRWWGMSVGPAREAVWAGVGLAVKAGKSVTITKLRYKEFHKNKGLLDLKYQGIQNLSKSFTVGGFSMCQRLPRPFHWQGLWECTFWNA